MAFDVIFWAFFASKTFFEIFLDKRVTKKPSWRRIFEESFFLLLYREKSFFLSFSLLTSVCIEAKKGRFKSRPFDHGDKNRDSPSLSCLRRRRQKNKKRKKIALFSTFHRIQKTFLLTGSFVPFFGSSRIEGAQKVGMLPKLVASSRL